MGQETTSPANTIRRVTHQPASGALAIPLHRFPDWSDLRQFVVKATRSTPRDTALHLFPPGPGPAWVLERFLRGRVAGRRVTMPTIGPPIRLFEELATRLDPPFRRAPDIAREIWMEEALDAGAGDPDAPRGDAVGSVESLARLFLAFLDQQAGDSEIRPDQPAFAAFVRRVGPRLEEAAEGDDGARRLARLAHWLERVVTRYHRSLEDAARADEDGLRRRLLADADALRPHLRNHRCVALGLGAFPPADVQLLLALLPPGGLSWALVEGAPDPLLPAGATLIPATAPAERDRSQARRRPPSLFDLPPPAPSRPRKGPVLLHPERRADGAKESTSLVFAVTDREQEARLAVRLLAAGHESGATEPPARPPTARFAIAARGPLAYLAEARKGLTRRGFAIESRFQPDLPEHPWAAVVNDALEFAAHPGRLTAGLRLLRNPFFEDPRLSVPPPRAADLLEEGLSEVDARNTNKPGDLANIAQRLRQEAERQRQKAETWERRQRKRGAAGRTSFRHRRARTLRLACDAVNLLDTLARELEQIRARCTGFGDAVRMLIEFLDRHFAEPDDERVREAIRTVLDQAADAAPRSMRASDGDAFARRVRRLLTGRPLPGSATTVTATPQSHVSLVAARDVPWGEWDGVLLLGLCDADWPGQRPANAFFPARLLEKATRERQKRQRPQETELLRTIPGLPRQFVAFTRPLTDDSFPVSGSPFEPYVMNGARSLERKPFAPAPEAVAESLDPLPRELDRTAPSACVLDRPVSPTAMEDYLKNPAQFFGRRVLRLDEERPPSDLPPPTQRGKWLHEFLEEAFQALGRGVTADTLGEDLLWFRAQFARFCSKQGLTDTDACVEERWLFGTETSPGALEWYLREEAGRGDATPCAFEARVAGEVEPGSGILPALRIHGRLDRLDELADGSFRILEYKSGRSWKKPAQGRLYARLVASERGRPATYAIPYFGSREWIGPDDKPNDDTQDEEIRAAHTGLAAGEFPAPAPDGKGGKFDFPLIVRDDLPDPEPEPRDGEETAPPDGVAV